MAVQQIDLRTRASVGVTIAAGAVFAAAAVFVLISPRHLTDPSASAGIETAITGSALAGAVVLAARFSRTRRVFHLLLLSALATAAVTDLASAALPALAGSKTTVHGTGVQLVMQAVAALAFVAAAFAPNRAVTGGIRRSVAIAAACGLGLTVLAGVLDIVLGSGLVRAAVPASQVAAAAQDSTEKAVALFSSGALVVAGLAFAFRYAPGKRNPALLASASFALAAARLEAIRMPVAAADWVTPDDVLRLAAYVMLLLAALRAYTATREEEARAALAAQRRRIARDLHDGLAQDLALISLHSQDLQSEPGTEHPLAIAARRALAASRGTMYDLSAADAPSLDAAIRHVAAELGERFRLEVNVEIAPQTSHPGDLEPDQREQVVRIAREAITNAARHGGARRISVLLESSGSGLRLCVIDDGRGIPEGLPESSRGFGLRTMHARAQTLGGRLSARRGPEGGTEVELQVP